MIILNRTLFSYHQWKNNVNVNFVGIIIWSIFTRDSLLMRFCVCNKASIKTSVSRHKAFVGTLMYHWVSISSTGHHVLWQAAREAAAEVRLWCGGLHGVQPGLSGEPESPRQAGHPLHPEAHDQPRRHRSLPWADEPQREGQLRAG